MQIGNGKKLKSLKELGIKAFNEKYKYVECSYTTITASFGYELLVSESTESWDGDTLEVLKDGDKYGLLIYGWGSCSICDALESCKSLEEVEELREDLHNSIIWYDSKGKLLKYIADKDWEGNFIDDELVQRFIKGTKAVLCK